MTRVLHLARTMKTDDNKYQVVPPHLGVSSLRFKNKADADVVAFAINAAHQRGRDEIKADFRDLMGVHQ